ncbi:hypothetical protein Cfor_00315 [Coptotermes formosanus]|uniref:Uncharacterized protein n=1 Tax=Coptotermes formosanus TaxID=36987 RepID=A0A6L2PYN7_COPFO|nr:hypothetical protein Cfor_00315 [Coptotermes formosanus]
MGGRDCEITQGKASEAEQQKERHINFRHTEGYVRVRQELPGIPLYITKFRDVQLNQVPKTTAAGTPGEAESSLKKDGIQTIILTLWILLEKISSSSANNLGYALEPYDESSGVYFQKKGQATLYDTEWKTIVYVPLKPTTNQTDALDKYISYINKLCNEVEIRNWTECNHFEDTAKNKLQQVKSTEVLRDITDFKENGKRAKRGVFNFIGAVSKILFGTMDDDDEKYYNKQIGHFEQNSDSMTHLLKQ